VPGSTRIRPHGARVRGADISRSSILFDGPFGRIFRAVPPADFGSDDAASLEALKKLADAMISPKDATDPKDGPDPEEGGIPAAYTYFGQFIDHDLTFDPASSLQRQDDPDALVDYRTPRFDLDNVYGRGPDDQPYLYADGRSFILGQPLSGAAENPRAKDLPRSQPSPPNPNRAIIGDPRNDENIIVSQMQGLWHRFHNKIAADHPDWNFERIQREVRFHYQWLLLHDFLPAIVFEDVLRDVLPLDEDGDVIVDSRNLRFFHPRNELFMPLEFSAAAYRFGHSMIRPGYRLSETIGPLPLFALDPDPDLRGFRAFPSNWAMDWNLFMDLEPRDPDNTTRTQLAYKMDTSLVNPLSVLPASVAINPSILALRNLERGWRMRLPSGQNVARAMGIRPLADRDILIGKFTGNPADIVGPIDKIDDAFAGNCPLWTYVLAETVKTLVVLNTTKGDKHIETRKLGPVGGRIVAETFAGLLLGDSSSYIALDPLWRPNLGVKGKFGLRELIATALQG
jgi:Animal haem peroxidase